MRQLLRKTMYDNKNGASKKGRTIAIRSPAGQGSPFNARKRAGKAASTLPVSARSRRGVSLPYNQATIGSALGSLRYAQKEATPKAMKRHTLGNASLTENQR